MKLQNLGSNKSALTLRSGTTVYFSYSTPVAAFVPGVGFLKTDKTWSVTTSKHIGLFSRLQGYAASERQTRPQEFFDDLIHD